jgi:quercetin dioxygenase-like cupin family protein
MGPATALQRQSWTSADMAARVVRYDDLKPCYNAFIDSRSPGSEAKENFTIIGPGVSENPHQHIHIAEAHGFNIGGARQPPNCINSQHSHDTAEIFVVHSGMWSFNLGETGMDRRITCGPGDVISLPTKMFRGFTNIGEDTGFLFAVLGKDDPGRVLWAPYVFDMAQDYGLVLLETGDLIDTKAGEHVPDTARPMPRTTQAQIDDLRIPGDDEIPSILWRSPSAVIDGAFPIIGNDGPLSAENDITLQRVDLNKGSEDFAHTPARPEVVFVHQGSVDVFWDGGALTLNAGDTMSVPIGLQRRFAAKTAAILYIVGGR